MSTQVLEPTVAAPPHSAPAEEEFRSIALDLICPSRTNPRKTRDSAKLNELADSIRMHGVLQPIVVRPKPPEYFVTTGSLPDSPVRYVATKNLAGGTNRHEAFGAGTVAENEGAAARAARAKNGPARYEIVAGERRWRAAQIAGLAVIPARVRSLTDQQVVEIQVIENLQREDVHPLEEAAGFDALIRDYAYTASVIAEKIGCHESYVHKRLRLARLIEPARKAFAEGEISLNHAILLARLESAEQQKEAFELCFEDHWDHVTRKQTKVAVPAKSLDLRIREHIFLDLSSAPWNKHDETLLPKVGACMQCVRRTGANHLLFDDEDDQKKRRDHCLDRACFEAKRHAFVQIAVRDLATKTGEEPVRIATGWCDDRQLKKLGAVRSHTYTQLHGKKDRCEHAEKAVVVYGDNAGHTIEICREAKCRKHNPHGASSARSSAAIDAAERKRKTEARIDGAYKRELWRRTWETVQPLDTERRDWDFVAHCLIERVGHDARKQLCELLALKPVKKQFGTDFEKPIQDYYTKLPDDQVLAFLVMLSMSWSLLGWGGKVKDLERYARDLKLDPAGIRRQIAAPILAKAKKAAASAAAKKRAPSADQKKHAKALAARASAGEEPEIEDADPDDYADEIEAASAGDEGDEDE